VDVGFGVAEAIAGAGRACCAFRPKGVILSGKEDADMGDTQITLTADERSYLVQVLESALKNHRVEEHRTRAPSYREQILQEEKILEQLLAKLGHTPK
jgi:hypothetical protein